MIFSRMKNFGDGLVKAGLQPSDLVTHVKTFKLIAYCCDGRLPYLVTRSSKRFELQWRYEDRHLMFTFNTRSAGDVKILREHRTLPANTYQIQDAFDWLLEGAQRANYAKEIVEDLLTGFIPPYIFVEYTPRNGRRIELDREKFHDRKFQRLYDRFVKDYGHEHGAILVYAREAGEDPKPSQFVIDPVVLEKAFYTGDFRPDTVLPE